MPENILPDIGYTRFRPILPSLVILSDGVIVY